MGIAPPVRVTNDGITFIIDQYNSDNEEAGEDPEEGSIPLVDQYRDELES